MNKEEKLKKEKKARETNKLRGLRITLIIFIIIFVKYILSNTSTNMYFTASFLPKLGRNKFL